jgi:hypothetical protein
MTAPDEVQSILAGAKSDDQKVLYFVALLRREANLGPDDVIVVGGSAVEIYTEGAYVSGDIDVCAPRQMVSAVLNRWGFTQPGREWARLDWKVVLDVVGPQVSGSMRLTRVVETPYGPVRVSSIEDLIIRRLALGKFWNEPKEYRNALLLAVLPGINWPYLEDCASRENLVAEVAQLRATSTPGAAE